jgi:hypothetical protein
MAVVGSKTTGHNHLDRLRRDPGVCPGCDDDWALQKAVLAARVPYDNAVKQVEGLVTRHKTAEPQVRWCTAIVDVPIAGSSSYHVHDCAHHRDHKGAHWCTACQMEWKK